MNIYELGLGKSSEHSMFILLKESHLKTEARRTRRRGSQQVAPCPRDAPPNTSRPGRNSRLPNLMGSRGCLPRGPKVLGFPNFPIGVHYGQYGTVPSHYIKSTKLRAAAGCFGSSFSMLQLCLPACVRKMDASPERSLEPLGQPKGPSQLSCKTKDPWHSHKKNLPKLICGDSICRPPENKQGKVQ